MALMVTMSTRLMRLFAKPRHKNDKPTVIICKTTIGKGSPNKQGGHDVHGSPLGKDEVAATRAALGITEGAFEVPESVRAVWNARETGAALQAKWDALFSKYQAAHPTLASGIPASHER